MKREVVKSGLQDRVHFLGRKPRNEVLRLYSEYDVFFYPSFHDSGAFTVLEAMAAGLPVICLDRGGPALSVNDDCGWKIEVRTRAGTCGALADAVRYYIRNPKMIRVHGDNAISRMSDEYNWSNKAERMLELYDRISKNKNT